MDTDVDDIDDPLLATQIMDLEDEVEELRKKLSVKMETLSRDEQANEYYCRVERFFKNVEPFETLNRILGVSKSFRDGVDL